MNETEITASVTIHELVAMAESFNVGVEPIIMGKLSPYNPRIDLYNSIIVKNMRSPSVDIPDRWAIMKGSHLCLNKKGRWEYQCMPSGRKDSFFKRCRFASAIEAILYYRRWHDAIVAWATKKLEKDPSVVLNYESCPSKLLKF